MKVLVTGASGILATNTIIQLLKNKYQVRALIRDKSMCIVPFSKELELIEGNYTDLQNLDYAVNGCDYIIHTAAETRQDLINYKDYSKINVDVTKNICDLAEKYHIKRIIYVSTSNVIGYGNNIHPGNETFPIKDPYTKSLYAKSKQNAQEIALSYNKQFDVVAVNPTLLIGPYDQKPSSGKIILMGFNKKLIFYPPGGRNFVHVTDAAIGIVNAITKGKNGEIYLLANENLTYEEFFKKLSKYSNTKPILIKIPNFILVMFGFVGNTLKLFRINNIITMTNMRILCIKNFYSNKKSETELKIKYKPIDTALNEFVNWSQKNNHPTTS